MTSSRSFRTILLALSVGALGAIGCVITVGAPDCTRCDGGQEPDALCHSEYNATQDVCECDAGYVFESSDPAGNSNFECERTDTKPPTGDCGSDPNNATNSAGQCVCVEGWQFCTAELDDYSCCPDGGTGTPDPTTTTTGNTATTGTDTDTDTDATDTDPSAESSTGGGTGPATLPDCDATLEGQNACTNNGGIDSVEDGESFRCEGGEWIPNNMDADCQFDGSDFAYGCYIDGDVVTNFCGDGPGTDCSDADDNCSSDTVLQSCLFGKLTDVDCEAFCTGKKAKIQTDFGTCEAKDLSCCCFDDGDEGNCQ